MTFCIARAYGNRGVLFCDTMISDSEASRPNIIPGRLKAIVLTPQVSVAYAGLANQGLDAVRMAKRLLDGGLSLNELHAFLRERSHAHLGMLDFIVLSHWPDLQIIKIWDGRMSGPLENAVIGDHAVLPLLQKAEVELLASHARSGSTLDDEHLLWATLTQLFVKHGSRVTEATGGVAVNLLASAFGHTYQNYASVAAWDTIAIPGGLTELQLAARATGATEFAVNQISSRRRGVAVLGFYLRQLQAGFVQAPLLQDEAEFIRLPGTEAEGQRRLAEHVERVAEMLGGILVD